MRYLTADVRQPILAVTTSERRALGLAHVAADIGADVIAATLADVQRSVDPHVLDATERRRLSLAEATASRAALFGRRTSMS